MGRAPVLGLGLGLALWLSACSQGGSSGGGATGDPVFHDCGNGWQTWMAGKAACPLADGTFAFPSGDPNSHIDYVMKLTKPKGTSLIYTIDGDGPFGVYQNADVSKACYHGPTVRIEIAASVQSLTGRYWQNSGEPLAPGTHTITIDLNPALWHDVNGQAAPANFADAATAVGFAFGDDCANGHGVYALAPSTWTEDGL